MRVLSHLFLKLCPWGLLLLLRGAAHLDFALSILGLASLEFFLPPHSALQVGFFVPIPGAVQLDLSMPLQGLACLDASVFVLSAMLLGSLSPPRGMATPELFLLALDVVHPGFSPSLRGILCVEPSMPSLGEARLGEPLFALALAHFDSSLFLQGMSCCDAFLSAAGMVHSGSFPLLQGVAWPGSALLALSTATIGPLLFLHTFAKLGKSLPGAWCCGHWFSYAFEGSELPGPGTPCDRCR